MNEQAPVTANMFINKQESVQVMSDGSERRQQVVSFTFDPTMNECVKTKSGDYIIRGKGK